MGAFGVDKVGLDYLIVAFMAKGKFGFVLIFNLLDLGLKEVGSVVASYTIGHSY